MASASLSRIQAPEDSKALFVQFLQTYLGINFTGYQSGFGIRPDMFLFDGPALQDGPLKGHKTTLSVPTDIMLLPQSQALAIIKDKQDSAAKSFGQI